MQIQGRMNRTCRVRGCWSPAASRYAAYCPPHRTALRRHGAVDQKAVTKAQLKPYLKLVKDRITRNSESIAWVTLDERWRSLVGHAEGILAYFAKGKAGSRFKRAAAQEVVKLAADVKPARDRGNNGRYGRHAGAGASPLQIRPGLLDPARASREGGH